MLRTLMVLTVLGLVGQAARAQDKLAAKIEALTKELDRAEADFDELLTKRKKELREAIDAAKTPEEKKALVKKFQEGTPENPGDAFAPKFFALAQSSPKDPMALDAIATALSVGGPSLVKSGLRTKILADLRANYLTSPDITKVVRSVLAFGDDEAQQFVRDLIAKNPNRKIQGRAAKQLAQNMTAVAGAGERMKADKDLKAKIEARFGKDFTEKVIANSDKWLKDADEWNDIVKKKYADVFPDLSVGKQAPEVLMKDINDKDVKLSSLKGKVVVLDVWATWCPPCRAMIPHEREMVEKLKNKPFVLVSISADAKKQTLTDFIAETPMPWTHWWNGKEGGILEDWEIHSFPTIYVLDAKGVIRFKNVRGEALEEAVNELLKEQEGKK